MICTLYNYNGKFNKVYKELTKLFDTTIFFKDTTSDEQPYITVTPQNETEKEQCEKCNYIKINNIGYIVIDKEYIVTGVYGYQLQYDYISNIIENNVLKYNAYGYINRFGGQDRKNFLYDNKLPLSLQNNVNNIYYDKAIGYSRDSVFSIYVVLANTYNTSVEGSPQSDIITDLLNIPYNLIPYKNTAILKLDLDEYYKFAKWALNDTKNVSRILGIYMGYDNMIPNAEWETVTTDLIAENLTYGVLKDRQFYKDFTIGYFRNNIISCEDLEPISSYKLWLPLYGYISLAGASIIGKLLKVRYAYDVTTMSTEIIVTAIDDLNNEFIINTVSTQIGISLPITYTNAADVERAEKSARIQLISSILGAAVTAAVGVATGGAGVGATMAAMGIMNSINYGSNVKDTKKKYSAGRLDMKAYEQQHETQQIGAGVQGVTRVLQSGLEYITHRINNVETGGGQINSNGVYTKYYNSLYLYIQKTQQQKVEYDVTTYEKMIGYPVESFVPQISIYINENNKGKFLSVTDLTFYDNNEYTLSEYQKIRQLFEAGVEI